MKCESGRHGRTRLLLVIVGFGFRWRDIPDRLQQTPMVEPVYPGQRGQLQCLKALPGLSVDELSFVEAVDRLGKGVIVAVANASHRRLDASLSQPLGVADRYILRTQVGMMDQRSVIASCVQGLFQRIQDEVSARRTRHLPADDAPGVDIDDEGHVGNALPGGYVREVRYPQLVGPIGAKLPIHQILRTRRCRVACGQADLAVFSQGLAPVGQLARVKALAAQLGAFLTMGPVAAMLVFVFFIFNQKCLLEPIGNISQAKDQANYYQQQASLAMAAYSHFKAFGSPGRITFCVFHFCANSSHFYASELVARGAQTRISPGLPAAGFAVLSVETGFSLLQQSQPDHSEFPPRTCRTEDRPLLLPARHLAQGLCNEPSCT